MSNCPFRVKLKPGASPDGIRGWHPLVTCPLHNHPAASTPLALPHFRKMGENSRKIVKMGSQIGRPVAEMLKELLEIGEVTTLQDISNVKRKFGTADLGGLTKIQAVLKHLEEFDSEDGKYFHRVLLDKNNHVNTLFFAHPIVLNVLKSSPDVLLMDCTYKVNQFDMPLLHITGSTPLGGTFDIAYCFLPGEKEPQYKVAIQFLCEFFELHGIYPKVAIMDWEENLKKAMREEFPEVEQRMCTWHLNKLIQVEATKHWDIRDALDDKDRKVIEEKRSIFLQDFNQLRSEKTQCWFDMQWDKMEREYEDYPELLEYIKSWNKVREQWADCYCNSYRDYGNHCNSPNEGAHHTLKNHMSMPQAHIYNIVKDIHLMLKSWKNQYTNKLALDRSRVPTALRKVYELKNVHFMVTTLAREKAAEQLKLAKSLDHCTHCYGAFEAKWGIPCCHTLYWRLQEQGDILLTAEEFSSHWWYRAPHMDHLEELPMIPQDPLKVKGKGRPKGFSTSAKGFSERITTTKSARSLKV
jgi:hypothetical protein